MQARSFILYTLLFAAAAFTIVHVYSAKKHTHSKKQSKVITPIIIIGGGVGGLCAGIHLGTYNPIIFQGSSAGGLLTKSRAIQNWPGITSISGQDLINNLQHEAESAGCKLNQEEVSSVTRKKGYFKITTQSPDQENPKTYFAHSVLLATGTTPLKLGIPGEETFWGNGISNCAVCDGTLLKGKVAGVVGGGETALEDALYLSSIAKKVYVFVRKSSFKSHEATRVALVTNTPNICVMFDTVVTEATGSSDTLTGVTVHTSKTETTKSIPLDGLFEAIGSKPNSSLVKRLVRCDSEANIITDEGFSTNIPGVFAIGDVTKTRYKQAIIVAQQAAQAATSITNYLAQKNLRSSIKPIVKPSHELSEHKHDKQMKASRMDSSVENCIIIGSGSSSMTAALYLGNAGIKPTVLEGPTPGGSLATSKLTHPWPSMTKSTGEDIAFNLKQQALASGAQFLTYDVTNINTQTWPYQVSCASPARGDKKVFLTKTILITTHKPISITTNKEIKKDAIGRYKTTHQFETSLPLVFATGSAIMDLQNHQLIAAGQGADAALNLNDILKQVATIKPAQTQPATEPQKSVKPQRAASMPHLHSIEEFKKAISSSKKVIIDCFATWCPPCQRLKPILEQLHKENTYPEISFYGVDTSEAEELTDLLGIRSLPTLIFYENNKEIHRASGFGGEAWLHSIIKNTFFKP